MKTQVKPPRGPGPAARAPARPSSTPPLVPRRYIDGLASVPWDLVRSATLSNTAKVVACGLAALCTGKSPELSPTNDEIAGACGLTSEHPVRRALIRLQAEGWIARFAGGVPSRRRWTIVLLWKVPDDLSDLNAHLDRKGGRP
jgi:hypothetical protein